MPEPLRSLLRQESVTVIRHRAAAGQVNPLATTLTVLYLVPPKYQARGRVFVTNRSAVATSYRISVQLAGVADDVKQYLAYDTAIAGNANAPTEEFALDENDEVNVYATLATLSFSWFGVEEPLP